MNIEQIDKASALRLINRLKTGTNVIFGAQLFSVGREYLIKGAEQVFDDLETTGDSTVRFIRGNYGVGKTNFCARLFNNALGRGWAGAYIELAEGITLHEFQQVFSQVVDKLYVPDQLKANPLNPGLPLGLIGIFDSYYRRLRTEVGLDIGADTSHSARADIIGRVNTVLTRWRIYSDFAAAVRCYMEARLDGDREILDLLGRWFRADQDVRIRERGILRPIQKINAKDHLRSLSCLLVGLGYRGLLIIVDELERIMQESRARRLKAYTLLRELIDNVDGENGMERTCFYCAAPPSQFESQKGFIEVESLASRIQEPLVLNASGPDPTGAIVNLDRAPLTIDDQRILANRLVALHQIARGIELRKGPAEEEISQLVNEIVARRPNSNTKVREFCVELISALQARYDNA